MLDMEEWMDIKGMKREGHSIREISRRTGRARNTVRRVLKHKAPGQTTRKPKVSILDEYKAYLKSRYEETGLSAVRLLEEIELMGYRGSVDTVRRYLKTIDEDERVASKATVRYETAPGRQAQVDWAEIGRMPDEKGVMKMVYAFVMVLGFSRMIYIEFTRSIKLPVLIECHLKAFEYFGGYTREILYDNMAQVRLPSGKLNPKMLDFANHYGITIKTHRPYRPRTKGKVERAVSYVKDNFIKGMEFESFEDLAGQGRWWMDKRANPRVHATTGEVPFKRLEKEGLAPLSAVPEYRRVESCERKVNTEGYVLIGGSRYSVPPKMVGKRVTVECGNTRVRVLEGDTIVATHREAGKKGESVTDPLHAAEMWKLTLDRRDVPKAKPAKLLIEIPDERPLTVYEEVIG